MSYSRPVVSRVLLMLLLGLALLSAGGSAAAQPEKTTGQSGDGDADDAQKEATTLPLGVYITSLHDFDVAEGTFGVDYWVWSVHPPGLDPLENLEFYNAREANVDLDLSEERGDLLLSQHKVSAVVQHDWDLSDFPFDKQVLEIDLEEGLLGTSDLVYEVDNVNSGYNDDIRPEGWQVTGFEIQERSVNYDSTFGDPDASGSGSSYARLAVLIELERDSFSGFFKLTAGVYTAVAIMLVSFLMVPEPPTIFSGRVGVLVGALFATIVNMQVSEAVLGRPEYLTLIAKIHIVALIFIFGAAVAAVFSRRTSESGKLALARRRDRVCLLVFGVAFALINAILILAAAVAG